MFVTLKTSFAFTLTEVIVVDQPNIQFWNQWKFLMIKWYVTKVAKSICANINATDKHATSLTDMVMLENYSLHQQLFNISEYSAQLPRVIIERVLYALTMMNVPVNHQYTLKSQHIKCMACSQCSIVKDTVAIRLVMHGMMTRRSAINTITPTSISYHQQISFTPPNSNT
jgi:hypothetical protein